MVSELCQSRKFKWMRMNMLHAQCCTRTHTEFVKTNNKHTDTHEFGFIWPKAKIATCVKTRCIVHWIQYVWIRCIRGHDVPSMHSNLWFAISDTPNGTLVLAAHGSTPQRSPNRTNKICSLRKGKEKSPEQNENCGCKQMHNNARQRRIYSFNCLPNANINCNRDSFHIPCIASTRREHTKTGYGNDHRRLNVGQSRLPKRNPNLNNKMFTKWIELPRLQIQIGVVCCLLRQRERSMNKWMETRRTLWQWGGRGT